MAITIPKKLIKDDDIVIIPRKEYEEMKASMIPSVYLKGRAARRLDKLVEEGLQEYNVGRTIKASSLKDALRIYKKRAKN